MSCIDAARNNARMVRTALTRETWEATNECWIELKQMLARKLKSAELPEVIDTVKRRAGLIRGAFPARCCATRSTTSPESAPHRTRGQHQPHPRREVLRAPAGDHPCRLLARQHAVGIDPALGLCASLLSLGLYGENKAANIADFLILSGQMPRSLAYCYEKITSNLGYVGQEYASDLRRTTPPMPCLPP